MGIVSLVSVLVSPQSVENMSSEIPGQSPRNRGPRKLNLVMLLCKAFIFVPGLWVPNSENQWGAHTHTHTLSYPITPLSL